MEIISYKNLIVWQKSIELVLEVYQLTDHFPKEEIFGLTSQMRRSAVSIASNIAEGRSRGYRKEFKQFLSNAFGSGAELETQLLIAKKLPKTNHLNYKRCDSLLEEIMKMLNSLLQKLKTNS
ncbi:MAG: S23 ribosomal protein [Parcubacteria group bacterium GW2011_GWA1_47_11]|nr:MAG: S23 ribosomal protein [Parcubacteria group bacterium GW2011_GWA1_47_11]